ncbi:MAG TPA: tyrosine-protein phosphatase [Mycobacteriales bacterium]|nr:tyrosine-protein phosphatase [Mycobacteriales bacterium]
MSDLLDAPGDRWVALEGAFNFRDLGGYAAGTRGHVRRGRLFRSDALQLLTETDVRRLEQVPVTRVIDLRTTQEIEMLGRGLLEGRLDYRTASLVPDLAAQAGDAPDDLADRYVWYLDVGSGALVTCLELIAESNVGAVAFHCAAGKDRTGVLAALVLSLLGVSAEDVVQDYSMTGAVLPRILDRLAADPVHGETVMRMSGARCDVAPATMGRFLVAVDEQFGGSESWALQAGLSRAALDALRAELCVLP